MSKTIIGVLIAALLAGGLVFALSRSFQRSNNSASVGATAVSRGALTAEEKSFDFGTVSMSKGKVKHSFKIVNSGPEAVVVKKMYTSCMCTTALLIQGDPSTGLGQVKQFGPYGMPGHGFIPSINAAIDPNGEVIVEAVYDPAAHGPAGVGKIQRTITIENNAGEPLELELSALVTP